MADDMYVEIPQCSHCHRLMCKLSDMSEYHLTLEGVTSMSKMLGIYDNILPTAVLDSMKAKYGPDHLYRFETLYCPHCKVSMMRIGPDNILEPD